MVFVNLQLKIKEGSQDSFIQELNKLLPETRSFERCHAVYFGQNQDDPTTLEFFSKWDSKEHYEKYILWRQESGVIGDVLSKYGDGEPVWRYFDLLSEF